MKSDIIVFIAVMLMLIGVAALGFWVGLMVLRSVMGILGGG